MSTLGYLYRSRSRRSYTERRGENILAENILAENILGQIYFMNTGDTSDLNPVLDDVTVLMLCSPLILCSALTCLNNQTLSLSLSLCLSLSLSLSLSYLISSHLISTDRRTLQHDLEEIRKGDEGYAVRPGSIAGNLGPRSSDPGSESLSAIEGEKVLQSQFSDILRVSAVTVTAATATAAVTDTAAATAVESFNQSFSALLSLSPSNTSI